jgi:hypothetical protein
VPRVDVDLSTSFPWFMHRVVHIVGGSVYPCGLFVWMRDRAKEFIIEAMDLFNKSFFRLALGFLGIVLTSVTVILLSGTIK